MPIRASNKRVEDGQPVLSLDLIGKDTIDTFIKLFNRAMSCSWEDMNDEMRELSDLLTHGKVLPSNRRHKVRDDIPNLPSTMRRDA